MGTAEASVIPAILEQCAGPRWSTSDNEGLSMTSTTIRISSTRNPFGLTSGAESV